MAAIDHVLNKSCLMVIVRKASHHKFHSISLFCSFTSLLNKGRYKKARGNVSVAVSKLVQIVKDRKNQCLCVCLVHSTIIFQPLFHLKLTTNNSVYRIYTPHTTLLLPNNLATSLSVNKMNNFNQ